MQRKPIEIANLHVQPYDLFHNQLILLTCGDFASGDFNAMTIGWGALGSIWSKPFAFVAVRPSRYTFEFMERYDTFTLSGFPPEYRDALNLLGSKSGREGDKISESGLTPEPSIVVAAPSYQEAQIVIECRKVYKDDLNSTNFYDELIFERYINDDIHRIYYGWIEMVTGTDKFTA